MTLTQDRAVSTTDDRTTAGAYQPGYQWITVAEGDRVHRRPDRRRPARRRPRIRRPSRRSAERCSPTRSIFFSGQDHLDDAGQYEFAAPARHADLPHPTVRGNAARRAADRLRRTARRTAGTPTSRSSTGSRRSACSAPSSCPAYGGTTIWANTVAAYRRPAPGPTRRSPIACGRSTPTCTTTSPSATRSGSAGSTSKSRRYRDEFASQVFETEHPVVRVHPETGERVAAARPLHQAIRRAEQPRLPRPVHPAAAPRHPAGEHRALVLVARRPGHLGQPRDPALRRGRLRRSEARAAPDHPRRRHPPQHRRRPPLPRARATRRVFRCRLLAPSSVPLTRLGYRPPLARRRRRPVSGRSHRARKAPHMSHHVPNGSSTDDDCSTALAGARPRRHRPARRRRLPRLSGEQTDSQRPVRRAARCRRHDHRRHRPKTSSRATSSPTPPPGSPRGRAGRSSR